MLATVLSFQLYFQKIDKRMPRPLASFSLCYFVFAFKMFQLHFCVKLWRRLALRASEDLFKGVVLIAL